MEFTHFGILMPDFMKRRRLARLLDQSAERMEDLPLPERGWISMMRIALGISAEQVGARKGVSRNAVYQAERSEQEGSISLKQMDRLAEAMGGKFIYAIVPNEPIEILRHNQAVSNARALAKLHAGFDGLSADEQQDWIDDTAAQQLHDEPLDFWANPDQSVE
jgi:predicted DNA-binding mobile mystery protein A